MKKLLTLTSLLALAACAGREAHPVAVVQAQDTSLSCPAISAEITANEQQARHLAGQAETHNVTNALVTGVGVLLFWPALFALDLTDYEKQEISALHERDTYLQTLAAQHGCTAS